PPVISHPRVPVIYAPIAASSGAPLQRIPYPEFAVPVVPFLPSAHPQSCPFLLYSIVPLKPAAAFAVPERSRKASHSFLHCLPLQVVAFPLSLLPFVLSIPPVF